MLNRDQTDLVFRLLFSSIFLLLGAEHLFADNLIRDMMPSWLPLQRAFSLAAGLVLIAGGSAILVGYHTRGAAIVLGCFLVTVTLIVHAPALLHRPETLAPDWQWLWDVYQRSNLVKNFCLLGVCFHLVHHRPGAYSLDARLTRSRQKLG